MDAHLKTAVESDEYHSMGDCQSLSQLVIVRICYG